MVPFMRIIGEEETVVTGGVHSMRCLIIPPTIERTV